MWGSSFVAIEVGIGSIPPLLFAAVRYDIAGLLMLGIAVVTTNRCLPRTRVDALAVGVGGVLLFGLHHALLYLGQQYVSGAVAAVIVSLVPVVTVLVAATALPDGTLTPLQYVGVGLGFLGVTVVAVPSPDALGSASLLGVGLVFLAAAAMAVASVALQPLSPSLSSSALQAWSMLVGAVVLHAGSALRGESLTVAWTPSLIASLAYLSLVSGVAAYLLYFDLLDRIGATELNLVSYAQPVAATAFSWLLFGTLVEATTVGGLLTIFGGFALVKRRALGRAVSTVRRSGW